MSEADVRYRPDAATVLRPSDIDDKPWEPLRGIPGVDHKVLWRSGPMIAGLVRMAPGSEEPGHVHHDADHHVYVVDGTARIAGQQVSSGGFVHVPAGVPHSTNEVGPGGCTFFYTYVPRG